MADLTIEKVPGALFGATIAGLDPHNITDRHVEQIWDAHREALGLLCFQFDRLLEPEEHHAVTAVFGESEFAPGRIVGIGRGRTDGDEERSVDEQVADLLAAGIDPFMTYLGNVNPKTLERADLPDKFFGEWEWHTDMSYIEVPPTFSLLHAREIPDVGGATSYASQVLAASELADDLRSRVEGVLVKHDSTYGSSGIKRPGMVEPTTPIEAIGHPHPVLRTVPATGQEALFLGRRTNAYVMGMQLDESEALLDELWEHATQPRFRYVHDWAVGQVVVWDNRMLLHHRNPFDAAKRRFMWRTQTKGEAVIPA